MFRKHLQAACVAAMAALVGLFGAVDAANATAKARVEWMKGTVVLGAETVTSADSSTSAASSAAPSFANAPGRARITAVSGAVVVTCCATSPVATQTNGVRLEPGQSFVYDGLVVGTKFAVIQATDAAATGGGGGGGGGASVTSTAAAPTYTEGVTSNNLSANLKGETRVIVENAGTISAVSTNVSNATGSVATGSVNVPTVAYNYCWNGASWDQCASASSVTVSSGTISLTANQGVTETPNVTPTYSAAFSGLVLAASGTDFLTITNTTNTKVTRLQKLTMTCTAASAAQITVTMVKRSTALDSGGTSSTLTTTPLDSSFGAGQSIVKTYTANPASLGTLVGNVRQDAILAATTTTMPDRLVATFGGQSAAAPAVRSATETIALNAGGVTTGATCAGTVELTEQ